MATSGNRESRMPSYYPLQDLPYENAPGHRAASIGAQQNDGAPQSDEPPRVPKTIRALQDTDAPRPRGRNLVICLDGTGDKFDSDNSNVVHLVSCLKKDDPNQVTYYQSGIGTYDGAGLSGGFSASMDMAVASGLGTHIKDAYRFLMQNYKEGDRICLFGFSRGAYTVRCLAGMIHRCGLLPAHNLAQVPFAYNFYKATGPHAENMAKGFKKAFCIDVSVYYVGLWDCVASVGFIPRKLPFSRTKTNKPAYFRHAMALDERRAKFKISRWVKYDKVEEQQAMSKHVFKHLYNPEKSLPHLLHHHDPEQDRLENEKRREHEQEAPNTNVAEVWFAGAHADVGGGAVHNETRHALSRIPLRWMIRQTFLCNTGILFNTAMLAEMGLDVHTLYPVYQPQHRPVVGPSPTQTEKADDTIQPSTSRRSSSQIYDSEHKTAPTGSAVPPKPHPDLAKSQGTLPEHQEDYFDSLAPINDQLVAAKGWWVLECWPVKIRTQHPETNDWVKRIRLNLGRYRASQDAEPVKHWTVKQREEEFGYKPQNPVGRNAVWRIAV